MSTEKPLELVDDITNLVGATRLGELVATIQGRETPYSSETVRNWVKQSKATPVTSDGRGKLFDPAHAETIAENVGTASRGGKRRNSGRRKKHTDDESSPDNAPLAKEMKTADDGITAVQSFIDRVKNQETVEPAEAVHVSELLNITRTEMAAVIAAFGVKEYALSPAQMSVLQSWLDARIKAQKFDKESGDLVKKDTVVRAVRDSHGPVVELLESLPQTLTGSLSPHSWIKASDVDRLLSMVHSTIQGAGVEVRDPAIVAMLDELRASLARPASHEATVRAVVRTAIESLLTDLVGSLGSE